MSPVQVIVTAAGKSSRMGGVDKLTLPLSGVPLLVRTVEAFLSFPRTQWCVVAVNPERVEEFRRLFQEHFPEQVHQIKVCAGGSHRQHSIFNALTLLKEELLPAGSSNCCPTMIHDGARPFVTKSLLDTLLQMLERYDGAIPALPVRDTVKRVEGDKIVTTEDRETLRLVQTPQVFGFSTIHEAHQQAHRENFLGTDDASLVEQYGGTVGWVPGPSYNLKVTVPEDIGVLENLYNQRLASR